MPFLFLVFFNRTEVEQLVRHCNLSRWEKGNAAYQLKALDAIESVPEFRDQLQ